MAFLMMFAFTWTGSVLAQQSEAAASPGWLGKASTATAVATHEHSLVLPGAVGAFHLPLAAPLEPDAIWQSTHPITQVPNVQGVWTVNAGLRSVAKFTLSTQDELISTLELPLVRLDKADVFWRIPGKPWKHAQAGDTLPISQWPVVSQHPTFLLQFETSPGLLDVIVVMQNDGFAETTALLSSERDSREHRGLQANVAGLLIGASAMVLLCSLLMHLIYRSTGTAYLMVYSACLTLAAMVLTGYGAIWFTPEWPWFNDSAKPLASTVAAISMLTAVLTALDRRAVGAKWRMVVQITAVLGLVYALVQLWVLPHAWRLAGGVGLGALVTVMGLSMGAYSWRRGDRFAPWVMMAVVFFALCLVVVSRGFVLVAGVDAFSMVMVTCLIASCVMLGYVLNMRERFGRAVIGRAATHRFRDPLTAVLSYEGLEREVEHLAVRQQTGGGAALLLYFSLQALDSFRDQDGYLVWQRDLVRFAAVLHKVLGEDWHIARLSNSKFGAVRLQGRQKIVPEQLLTLVLSNCSRKIDTQDWVDRVGLRMAATSALLNKTALEDLIVAMEQDIQKLPPGKRIVVM